MSAFFKGVGALLRKIWLWSLLLVLGSALLVWFAGPLLAVADHRFWQSSTARLLTISALFLAWGLAMVGAGGRRAARLRLPETEASHPRDGLVETEQRQVRGRFKEALHTLRTTRRYGERSARWRNELPWYLLIGEQGSGKSSLLAANGLVYPLDRSEARSSRANAYFDAYLADEAVVIEVAGRYLTQPDVPVDGAGWSTLLGLLKSRHRARPLNGVVVTLAVETLLGMNEHDLDLHARRIHTRLQDIQQRLHMDVPVYLILTQADRLPGFAEFFDSPMGDSAEAVLGEPLAAGKAGTEIGHVREAFERLLKRLGTQVIARLHLERDVERRGQMLDFPRQVAHIGERLCLFVETAFCAHRFQRINRLRGFYLACGASEDGRSYFVQGLFNRVIFAEADLAGLHTPERQRLRRRQGLGMLVASLLVVVAGIVWTHSYSVNHQRLLQLAQLLDIQPPDPAIADSTLALLPRLDSHRAATQVFPPVAQVRMVERVGLFQGEAVRPLLSDVYDRTLHQQLLPQVVALLEEQVRASLGDRETLMDTLRAYLMLNLPKRRDNAWLKERVAGHWSARYASDPSVQKRLNEHFSRLLEQPFVMPLSDDLVAEARQQLRGESLAGVVYRALRHQARNLEPYRLVQGRGLSAPDEPIPGFFTRRYVQYFEKQGPRLVNAIAQDNWVLGESGDLSPMDLRQLMLELEQRYFSEYADAWSHAIGQVRLLESDNLRQHAETLADLASAQSPWVQLLHQLRENTRLVAQREHLEGVTRQVGELGVAAQAGASLLSGSALPGQMAPDSARRALQRRFEPLHQLLDAEQNPREQLLQALRLLDEWQLQLAGLNRDDLPEQAAFRMASRRMDGQQPQLGRLRDTAARLPQPLKGWFDSIADDSWRLLLDSAHAYVNQRYQSELYGFYAKTIQRRYPFTASARTDVALEDFQEFFKPRGSLARFYDSHLRAFVSADGRRYRLRSLDGRSLPMSRSLLDQLSKAQMIRQGFFNDEQEWAVRFSLAPYSLDPAVSRAMLSIGDKQLEYRHGPIVPMVFDWPGEADQSRTSLVLERGAQRPLGIKDNSGAWSLFRFVELMQSELIDARQARLFKADLSGLRAHFLLSSQRNPVPLQWEQWRTFRLPEQL